MTAHTRLAKPLVDSLRKALTQNALPGETAGLNREDERLVVAEQAPNCPGAFALEPVCDSLARSKDR